MHDNVKINRALISVSDKTGLIELATALNAAGVQMVSTGSTAKQIAAAGFDVTEVKEVTGFPESLDGRVKTLHPAIHGGILADLRSEKHQQELREHSIKPFELVVVNLYPFVETVAAGAQGEAVIEQIDIGGPAMVRASAKNHANVAIVVDPSDYATVIEAVNGAGAPLSLRRQLAHKAFAHTASYDSAVANWFAQELAGEQAPTTVNLSLEKLQDLRYGENSHQSAAIYADSTAAGIAAATQHSGKDMSYNNFVDADAAYRAAYDHKAATVAIVKHANPCGVAQGVSLTDAYNKALNCDQTSAFGGIIALNDTLDGETAEQICQIFTEVVIAPNATDEAKAIFANKKNLRLLTTHGLPNVTEGGQIWRQVSGGYLIQDRDNGLINTNNLKVVTERAPTDNEISDMLFAWKVAKHVKSNAIVYVKDNATVGIGAGQMNRLDSTRIAARKSKDMAVNIGLTDPLTIGSVVASDAFFPFSDGLLAAAEAGATAIIQPGGSMRDDEIIAAANNAGLAMVFTNMRHFKH